MLMFLVTEIIVFAGVAAADQMLGRRDISYRKGRLVLGYTLRFRVAAVSGPLFLPVLLGKLGLFDAGTSPAVRVLLAILGLALAVGCAFGFREAFGTRFELGKKGITRRTWFAPKRSFAWENIDTVERSAWGNVVIRHGSGSTITVRTGEIEAWNMFVATCRQHLTLEQLIGMPEDFGWDDSRG